jgi:hypothetical protein
MLLKGKTAVLEWSDANACGRFEKMGETQEISQYCIFNRKGNH